MILMIDNYDSFTYNLYQFLMELNEEVLVKRNDEITIEDIKNLKPEIIVISPGPSIPENAGISLDIIDVFKEDIPILGICLGHQSIGYYFGMNIIRGKTPIHGKVTEIRHFNKGVFKNLKNPIKVTRYHSLVVENKNLNRDIEITALTDDNIIMGLRHKKYKIEGVQFHPEAILTEYGHDMLKNFLDFARGE
ncbi:aminodeoxychorismate/anthranilate synthase component II [Peptostreptococcaceae bacterium AGR-M142]